MKNLINKISSIIFAVIFIISGIPFTAVPVSAQSRSYNYNRNYSLGGSQSENLVSVAMAQKGRTKAQMGYTEAWCADFVSDCAKLAGLESIIPAHAFCGDLYNGIISRGGHEVSSPQRGDIVFYYDYYCSPKWLHTGIMISSSQAIEGNYSRKVGISNLSYRDSRGHSIGHGIVRKYVRPAYGTAQAGSNQSQGDGMNTAYAGRYYVNTPSLPLNMRNWPSLSAPVIAAIPRWTQIYVDRANSSWAHVSYGSTSGYCSMEYLKKVEEASNNQQSQQPQQPTVPKAKLNIWFSKSKLGSSTESAKNMDMIYFNYEILDLDHNNKIVDESYNLDFKVKETVYNPDGSVGNTCTYERSGRNWIGIKIIAGGNYRGVVEISGTWVGTYEVSLKDVPEMNNVHCTSYFSTSPSGAKVDKLEKGKYYYYNFKVSDNNGKLLRDITSADFNTDLTLSSPDGSGIIRKNQKGLDSFSQRFLADKVGKYSDNYTVKVENYDPVKFGISINCVDTAQHTTKPEKVQITGAVDKDIVTVTPSDHDSQTDKQNDPAQSVNDRIKKEIIDKIIGATPENKTSPFDVDTVEDNETENTNDSAANDAPEVGDELAVEDAIYTITDLNGDHRTVDYTDYEGDSTDVVIPDTINVDGQTYYVTSVSDRVFYKNNSIKAVSIGCNVKSIGEKAFYGCRNLNRIIVHSKDITRVGKRAFTRVPKKAGIYVPSSLYRSYRKMFRKGGISIKSKFYKIR